MVASMAYRETEVAAVPQVAEGALVRTPPDWRRLYEQTLERAEAAEARAEELKWAEVVARSAAESLKWQFKEARRQRLAAVEDANAARRAAKNALFLEAEVARLTRLLGEAGVDPHPRGTEISLRREVARLRTVVAAQVQAHAELRKALRRSRCQKAALNALTKENARLRRTAKASQGRVGTLEAELSKLRATAAVLSGTLYGRRSEKQQTPRCGRRRGQRSGAPGHGRTPRPGIKEAPGGARPGGRSARLRGVAVGGLGAGGAAAVPQHAIRHERVVALAVRALCVPASAAPGRAWLGDQGLPVAPGTLADSAPRFVPLFQPLAEAIRAHQNATALRHADETTWRVQALRAEGRSARAWLWTSVGNDAVYFHIDPSRSAEAAQRLFGELRTGTVIVCDRYSAYKKLARLLGGMVTLQFCWAHMRRDFIQCAAAQVDLTGWCQAWLARIAAIYRLNEARLAHYDPTVERQSAVFDAAQDALQAALDGLFARAGRELDRLQEHAREGKALRSLVNHREGLSVFVARPRTPMDNNFAERVLRGPVIGRRLSFGSDSETGARFTALMYSVVGTLTLNRIDVRRWLEAWLAACANNGGRPPHDTAPWLPWSMDDARRRELAAPT